MNEFRFVYPYLLLAIPVLLLTAFLFRRRLGQRSRLWFPQLSLLQHAPVSWRLRLARWLPPTLFWLALIFGITALARPQDVEYRRWFEATGVEIAVAIDTSGSMQIIDMDPRGQRVVDVRYYQQGFFGPTTQVGTAKEGTWDRLDVVKAVVGKFLSQRRGDQVTLTIFGTEARTLCPLTHDVQSVSTMLKQVEIGMVGQATDLRKSILYSLKRLVGLTVEDVIDMAKTRSIDYIVKKIRNEKGSYVLDKDAEKRIASSKLHPSIVAAMRAKKPRSQMIILLTDGKHTATQGEEGRQDVLKAAQAAALYGIKIYTIGIGSRSAYTFVRRRKSGRNNVVRVPNDSFDEDLMREISRITKGKFFSAANKRALEQVYQDINKLEPNRFKIHQWEKTRELYLWLLLPCLGLLGLELLSRETLFRRIP